MTDGKTFPAEVLQQIIAKTDGVPVICGRNHESHCWNQDNSKHVDGHYELTGSFSTFAIPATLQDSLMARLDRWSRPKPWRNMGRPLGGSLRMRCSRRSRNVDEGTLQQELGQAGRGGIAVPARLPPQATYLFKHALIQDAAYQSLLKSTRQQYHQRIAQVLEEQFPETARRSPNCWPITTPRRARRAGHWLLAAGGPTGQRPLGLSGSHQPLHHRDRAADDPARDAGAYPAGLDPVHRPRRGTADCERARSARSGAGLHPGRRCVSRWARRPSLSGPVGLWGFYQVPVPVPHGHESSATRCCTWRSAPTTPRWRSSPTISWVFRGFGLGRCRWPADTWRKASHATRQTSAVPWCSAWAPIRVLAAGLCRADPLVTGVPGASPGPPPRGPDVGTRAGASL